jgi:outer membrane protein assembly factor BamB
LDEKTGGILWKKLISSHNYSHPIVIDNLVLVSDTVTGRLQAYKKKSGEEVWSFSSRPPQQCVSGNRRKMPGIAAAPVIRGEDVYVGAADGYLYQLNLTTGKLKARSNLGSAIHATPVVTDQRMVVPTSSGVLYGIDLT